MDNEKITYEQVMEYCYSRNLMLVTKESLEYMHRPIVIETMNKNAIPVKWILNKYRGKWEKAEMGRRDFQFIEVIDELLADWEKENE